MADTIKTRAALVTLLADNSSKAISPQDVRDMLVSVDAIYGSLYMSAAANTDNTAVAVDTYQKMAGTTTESAGASNISQTANNRLEIDAGMPDRHYFIQATLSTSSSHTGRDYTYVIMKNGATAMTESEIIRTGYVSDRDAMAIQVNATLSAGDYIEVWVKSSVATGTVKADTMNLHMHALMS